MTSVSFEYSEEGRAFLQRRVARYGLHGANIGWFFLVLRIVEPLIHGHFEWAIFDRSLAYHFFGALGFQAIWLLCRTGTRSVRFIRTVEAVGTLFACSFYCLMMNSLPVFNRPEFIVLLALSFGMFARAVYVPSSSRRTLFIMSLSGLPLLAVSFYLYFNVDIQRLAERWADEAPWVADETPGTLALGVTAWVAAWWVVATVICSAASNVIYGLRKEVRNIKRLGQYTLVEKLGEGGMGMVYRAEHAMLRRPTAVKLLPIEKAGELSVARFEKEVQFTAMLTHPNTVTIFDYGRTPDSVFYYAMEHLDGATLETVVKATGPMPPARAVHVLMQAADALAEAHGRDLIHRDIKPTNIMLVEQGGHPDVAKVLDFGLVKELERDKDLSLTDAGAIAGTPRYLSPEAIKSSEHTDARSDIYALGAVGYYLLTGSHVFDGGTVVEVCAAHLHRAPTPPSKRLGKPLPAALERLILSCLEKQPESRPQSAAEFRQALRSCPDLASWSEDDARAWWERFGARVKAANQSASVPVAGKTVDIDMARRR
ncbi:MAG: serine/threonine-protein kinase [Myxococcota bacterium]